MKIRVLDAALTARIAAGEVVERPASVVKELIENAIDAGATKIDVMIRGALTGSIIVSDDGCGIPGDQLRLALARHATSKLADGNVSAITTLGFRGEALPSMAAVGEVRLVSRHASDAMAFEVTASEVGVSDPRPVGHPAGTRVEINDLFSRYPARLRFLKSDRTEMAAVREVVDAAALAFPDVEFSFRPPGQQIRYLGAGSRHGPDAVAARARTVLGEAFRADGIAIDASADGVVVRGLACLPTRTRKDANGIFLAVNGRPVSDKGIVSAVRAAYAGLIAPGTTPMAFVSIAVDPRRVDVNVHPRKAEIRLSDAAAIHALVVEAITSALREAGLRTTSHLADLASELAVASGIPSGDRRRLPLGQVIGQANGSWIVSETMDGIVIVDQHAAHERVVLERLKERLARCDGSTINLPTRVDVQVSPAEAAALADRLGALSDLGLKMFLEEGRETIVSVWETPAALGPVDAAILVAEIAAAAVEDPSADVIGGRLLERLATAGCRAAIKAGQSMSLERADQLLREMEVTPNASTCNHGRPVVVFLSGDDLERLFGRK